MKKLALVIPLLLLVAMQLPFVGWVPDDAYISFRYAQHLSRGDGLVFNIGERVEGFSNPLWTLYLGLAGRLGLDIVTVAVISSSLAALAALLLFWVLLRRFLPPVGDGASPLTARLAFLFTCMGACFFPLAFYATSGMESTAYLLFLLLGFSLQTGGMLEKRTAPLALASLPFLVAALLRPEGILFLGGSILFTLVSTRPLPRLLPAALLLPLILFSGALAVKARYFGDLLPNTYYAKPGCSLAYLTPALEGAFYLFRFAIKSGLLLLLPFALYPPRERRRLLCWFYLWFMTFLQIFFIAYAGVDVLRFDRFVLPFYPCYMALAMLGVSELLETGAAPARRFLPRFIAVCIALIIACNIGQAALARSKRCTHDWMHGGSLRTLGRLIRATFPDAGTVVANEVGAVAYYSGFTVIDMLGLTDRTVSRIRYRSWLEHGTGSSEGAIEAVGTYMLSRDPDIIVLPSFEPIDGGRSGPDRAAMHPLWYGLWKQPRFQREFAEIATLEVHAHKYLTIYARHGTRVARPDPALWRQGPCSRISWYAARSDDPSRLKTR